MPITIILQEIITPQEIIITLPETAIITTAPGVLLQEAIAPSAAHQEAQVALAAEEAAAVEVVHVAVAAEEEVNNKHISVPCLF